VVEVDEVGVDEVGVVAVELAAAAGAATVEGVADSAESDFASTAGALFLLPPSRKSVTYQPVPLS
jgi:NADPH:quinone reductase-like Zn-dependent oxidoreductase